MQKPDEIPLIKVEEYLKIVVTERTANSDIIISKIALNKRVLNL